MNKICYCLVGALMTWMPALSQTASADNVASPAKNDQLNSGYITLPTQTALLSPDGHICVKVECQEGKPVYSVTRDGTEFLLTSPLGVDTNIGDYTQGVALTGTSEVSTITDTYSIPNIKSSHVDYRANSQTFSFAKDGAKAFDVEFRVSNCDVAFRYQIHQRGTLLCCVVKSEATGFRLPEGTTTFICPMSKAMEGWSRTYPSYETQYVADDTMGKNGIGEGYSFPCLFHNGDKGWTLISETGVDGLYCGSRLMGHEDGLYTIGYPQPEEMNGNGSAAPGISLPGYTPWRTVTIGETLAPIMETTVAYDLVTPRYEPSTDYSARYGKGSWSWIIAGDVSMNFDMQKRYIDFSAEMGYESVLVDALWDTQVGREGVEELARYAKSKGVSLFLWYNSNGYWNDAPQGPRNLMNNIIVRRREMAWMKSIGVRGIKVDFWGSDKQQTMQLYEEVFADANDFGLMVLVHGCTLPRGWERMYPNFVAAEAVLASENMMFMQSFCDSEAYNACLHPFIRNTVAAMDFGGSTLNKYYNEANDEKGNRRRTSDVFALAVAVMFQSAFQHFALAPNNLTDAPSWALDFMKAVPTTWDEVKFIDGYPGRYVVMARRHGDKWYIAGINAEQTPRKMKLSLPMLKAGQTVTLFSDNERLEGSSVQTKVGKRQEITVNIPCNGGVVVVADRQL
jgi:hypothetical protein